MIVEYLPALLLISFVYLMQMRRRDREIEGVRP